MNQTENVTESNYKNRVKSIRKKEGLTQREFAEKLNIGVKTISDIEKGIREPSTYVLEQIYKIFNYPIGYIMGMETQYVEKDISISLKNLFVIKENEEIDLKSAKHKKCVEIYLRLTKENLLKIFENDYQETLKWCGFIDNAQWEKRITGGIFRYPENKEKDILVHSFTYEI